MDWRLLGVGEGVVWGCVFGEEEGEERLCALKSLLKSKIRAQNLKKYVMTEKNVLTLPVPNTQIPHSNSAKTD
jgi:hypothetical protein